MMKEFLEVWGDIARNISLIVSGIGMLASVIIYLNKLKDSVDKIPGLLNQTEEITDKVKDLTSKLDENKLAEANAALELAKTNLNLCNKFIEEETAKVDEIINNIEVKEVNSDYLKSLIKIPDVYSLTLTFNSLIPDNFNNFLHPDTIKLVQYFENTGNIYLLVWKNIFVFFCGGKFYVYLFERFYCTYESHNTRTIRRSRYFG